MVVGSEFYLHEPNKKLLENMEKPENPEVPRHYTNLSIVHKKENKSFLSNGNLQFSGFRASNDSIP
jgi:hypothetical protein